LGDVALSETTAIELLVGQFRQIQEHLINKLVVVLLGVVEQEHLQLAILLAVFMILLLVQQHL
jgi:hypothetical protein